MNTRAAVPALLLGLLAAPLAARDEAVVVRARLEPGALEAGGTGAFVVELAFSDGVHASEAGIPAPFLQLDVPACLELTEPALTTYDELAKAEFLQLPYERLMQEPRARVPFRLRADPPADATVGLVVSGYVTTTDDAFFLRRRLELPLRDGAEAVPGDDRDSSWGVDDTLLQIGDTVPDFTLPGPDGTRVTLSERLAEGHALVTTYRAFW